MPQRRLRPFFSYYGSKWRLAPRYPAPAYEEIIEPFAGSAGYSLLYPERQVLLIDANPQITEVWRYLINVRESEMRRLPDIPDSGTVDDLSLPQEIRWLIGWCINKSQSSPAKRPSTWARDPEHQRVINFWSQPYRERIAAQLRCVRHWRVLCTSYDKAPDHPATWFVDPPYAGHPGNYYREHGSKHLDYTTLGAWCKDRRGQVMVCEAQGADWLPFEPFADTRGTVGRSQEALWTVDDHSNGGYRRPKPSG